MGYRQWSIRTKLIVTFVAVGAAPLIVSNIVSYIKANSEIESQAAEMLKAVEYNKAAAIKNYFEGETRSMVDLADTEMTRTALLEFSAPFAVDLRGGGKEWVEKYRADVAKFYSSEFGGLYLEKTKQKLSVDGIVDRLDPMALAAQYDFIVTNENPLGKKDQLVTPKRTSSYSKVHERFHTAFRNYQVRHGLYDLFLVDLQGRVVYSVFKETDFATSLKTGPWAQTGLARAFESATKLAEGEVYLEDFSTYTPSYESPASFAATPVFFEGKPIGSLVIQLPLDRIAEVVQSRQGLGKGGETLLLGADRKLRADTFRNKTTHNVASSFEHESKVSVDSPAVQKALSGATGIMDNVSYDGIETLAYFEPLKIKNLTWYIVVELPQSEIHAGIDELTYYTMGILLTGVVVIFTVAFLFGASIGRTLTDIVQRLNHSSREVSSASSQSASSATELSEASTEQAASLQETMASVEEISAMVNQNADSTMKTQSAVSANEKTAEEGSNSVDEMIHAIGEIKDTNQEILTQMESSNREFGEIVKIISEIGDKTNVINEIVFQTKLLSFNASVEAARAGEHGKGFAVVAEEVGNLAQMSGNAAKEITDMLTDSIKRVNGIVERTKERVDQLIETGKDKIDLGQSKAEKCREAIVKITENARTVSSMITEIAHASKEQAQGIQEINKAISQLDQVTQQNSAVAQQSSTQAEQLNTEATSLAQAVETLVLFSDGKLPSGKGEEHEAHRPEGPSASILKLARRAPASPKSTGSVGKVKKVVGGQSVPSASDSNFEEF